MVNTDTSHTHTSPAAGAVERTGAVGRGTPVPGSSSARGVPNLATRSQEHINDNPLLPPIVDAVKAYATVGEIANVLRDEFGEYQPGR